jgi:hypothetical protein
VEPTGFSLPFITLSGWNRPVSAKSPDNFEEANMAKSQWHRFYNAKIAAQPALVFELLSDMPNYGRWLPQS